MWFHLMPVPSFEITFVLSTGEIEMEIEQEENKKQIIIENQILHIVIDDFSSNSYYIKNPQMFTKLCMMINHNRITAISRILLAPSQKLMYDWICSITSDVNGDKISERLYWILNDIHEYPKCKHPDCNNYVNSNQYKSIAFGYYSYCSYECKCSSPIISSKRKLTNSLKTSSQIQEEKNKRLAIFNRHKAEDPDFLRKIQEKSIATRKHNHGEDYTGRKKCWNTIKDRYGVSNPMSIKEVQDKLKQHNLETYGVEWHIAAPEIREKSMQTMRKNYGVDNPFVSEEIIQQIRQHNLDNYGVEHNWQREDVKQHIRETNKRLYGYESAMQNPEIRSRMMSNIKYDGKSFDSYPELCFYIWLVDNSIPFEFQPKTAFEYAFDGKQHVYCPDFKVGDMYFEIKGDHFFKNGKMICPFRYSNWDNQRYAYECDIYEAKHQCMLQNDVIILKSSEYLMFVKYVNQKMGNDFYKFLKESKKLT